VRAKLNLLVASRPVTAAAAAALAPHGR
jgi:hypothetical protein